MRSRAAWPLAYFPREMSMTYESAWNVKNEIPSGKCTWLQLQAGRRTVLQNHVELIDQEIGVFEYNEQAQVER